MKYIYILHNGIQSLPEGRDFFERTVCSYDTDIPIRDLYIKGLWLSVIGGKEDLDCLIKHHHMILNPSYGLLGMLTLFYQLLIELLGPVFWIIYIVISVSMNYEPLNHLISLGYVLIQVGMVLFAASFGYRHKTKEFIKLIPKLILISIAGIFLHILIIGARLYGMITFHWRRMVW